MGLPLPALSSTRCAHSACRALNVNSRCASSRAAHGETARRFSSPAPVVDGAACRFGSTTSSGEKRERLRSTAGRSMRMRPHDR